MLRASVLLCVVGACAGASVRKEPLPQAAPTSLAALTPQQLRGERIRWSVFYEGMEIGHASLETAAAETHAAFQTGMLASALAHVHYDLRTEPNAATESLSEDGASTTTEIAFDAAGYRINGAPARVAPGGVRAHTLASALGLVRTWSRADAPPPAFVWIVHAGDLYRLDVYPPTAGEWQGHRALRVDAVVRSFDRSTSLEVSLWLAASADRTPVRFVVRSGGTRVAAELSSAN